MKNIFYLFTIFTLLVTNISIHSESNNHMNSSVLFGQEYIDLIHELVKDKFNDTSLSTLKKLFAPNIKKVVNSKTICTNIDQVTAQMKNIEQTDGVDNIKVLELIESKNSHINILQFEITYKNNSTESVITILKRNDKGQIEEVNEVFGEKDVYQWQP